MNIQTRVISVTPLQAQKWLSKNPNNRPKRQWWIELLAEMIKRGEWVITHQGIAIDTNGNVLDGQHRLEAIILAGMSVDVMVTENLNPAAMDAIDQGVRRTVSDVMSEDKRIAEVMRLGAQIAVGSSKPTIQQIRESCYPVLRMAAKEVVDFSGGARKFYSSAPMKLAASVLLLNGQPRDYVLSQYRALVLLDFDSMSQSAKALVRQVESGKTSATNTRETLARGLRVFDASRRNVTKIQVSEADINAAREFAKTIILGCKWEVTA